MSYWIEDHLGWVIGAGVGAIIALIVVLAIHDNRNTDLRYHAMLDMAHNSHDSLMVMLTFEKSRSDAANAAATSSAIITAGAIAGSRR